MELIERFIPHLQELGYVGYWLILAVTFAETFVLVGIFVPGTVILVMMGGLAHYGYYDYLDLGTFAIIGAITGNIISYELGRKGKLHVEKFHRVARMISGAKNFVQEHGGKSVLLARFIGPIRPIIPFVAGVMEMKRGQFYLYTLIGAFLWCPAYLALGYAFGYAWDRALAWSSAAVTGLVAVLLIFFFGGWAWRWYRRRFV